MGTDGYLKLADFGASKFYDELVNNGEEATQSIVGTPYWMAPEVVNQSGYNTKADIWSVGCVVVEMLTGSHPYHEMNQFAAIFQISQGKPPPFPESISDEGKDFLRQCFHLDPNTRPNALELLSHPFLKSTKKDVFSPQKRKKSKEKKEL